MSNLFSDAFLKVQEKFIENKNDTTSNEVTKDDRDIKSALTEDLGLEDEDFIQPVKTETGEIKKQAILQPEFVPVGNDKVLIKPPSNFNSTENNENANPMKAFLEQTKIIKKEREEAEKKEQAEAEANKSRFSDEDKQSVILSLIMDKSFEKTKTISASSKITFGITFKTLTDAGQEELNNELQKIDLIGEVRENTVIGPNGVGQKMQIKYNVDSTRARRIKIFAYHLVAIGNDKFKTTDEAEKVLKAMPTKFLDTLYRKGLVPFLELVDEACNEVEVF